MSVKELKILYLEDNEADAILVREQLKSEGLIFNFVHVSKEIEFVDKLNSEKYDVILSDYNLPGFSGIAALILSKKICPDVPYICISGTIGEDMAVELIHIGASDYINKNNLSKLHAAIQRALKEAEERKARIEAEKLLIDSEARFRDIIMSTYDWVWEIDKDCKYCYTSENIENILGYSADEVIGKTPYDLMPPGEKSILSLFNELVEANSIIKDLEYWSLHKNGNQVCLLTNGFPIFDEKGNLIGYRGVGKDITDRKRAENEITRMKESLQKLNQHLDEIREEERASIAREIHDQLGQSLTALKIDVEWLSDRLASSLAETIKLKGMVELISAMIMDVQRIASDLRPPILDDLGLMSAMEWYIREFEKRTGIRCQLKLDNIQFPNEKKNLTLYRILQEVITNVSRHAMAKNVIVKFKRIKDFVLLEVTDDGIGLSIDEINSFRSLGFIGIRERLKQHNGNLEIQSEKGRSTSISITIPFN